jgi:hypothetical protein
MTAPQTDADRKDPPKSGDPDPQQNQDPQGGQQPPDSGGDTGQAGDQGDSGSDSGDSGLSLEEQLDAEKRKNTQLSRQLTQAKNEKTKSDQDKDAAKERDDFKAENTKLKGLMDSKFLLWCIGTDTKHQWQDPEDVVKFIKADEINIDVDAETVEGLDLALKRIAKDKPYLLVPKQDDQQPPRTPSGSHPVGSKPGSTADETKRLGAKYKIPGFGTQAQKFM